MVLTREELIASLREEVRILLHLAGKVDKSQIDYRPTAKQRSTLELLRYLAMMGPTLIAVLQTGTPDRATFSALWGPAEAAAKAMNFDQAVAAIEKQSDEYASLLGEWSEADFRTVVDMFGSKASRGAILVKLVLGGHAAYRTQLFSYLKACGREELNTMNLWGGADGPA